MRRDDEMNGCPSFENLMSFMDGELSPGEAALLGAHLEKCPDCRRVLESQGVLEKSYRESFSPPSEDAFRLMEKRVMASAPRTARRIPASIQIAAALILTLAGMRLVAGHETGLLPGRQTETIVVTAESISGGADDGAPVLDQADSSIPVESVSSASSSTGEVEQGLPVSPAAEGVEFEEQSQENRADGFGTGGLYDATLAMESAGTGGGSAVGGGAAGQALPSGALGNSGSYGVAVDDMVQTACQAVPECLSISEERGEPDFAGFMTAGRTCDADGASGASEAPDLERSGFESFAPGGDQAVGDVAGAQLATSSIPPACLFLVFKASGEPASPDSVFLDESFPGWKDSLRGEMRDTTLVLSRDGFAELMF